MRILIVHNYYQRYGGEDSVVEAEKNLLRNHGHEVILYKRLNTRIKRYGLFKKASLYFNIHWSQDDYEDIKNVIKKHGIDVAHIHNTFLLVTHSAYYACKELGVPVVQTLHNYRFLCPSGNFYTNSNICEECFKRKDFIKGFLRGCWRHSKLLTFGVVKMINYHNKKGTFRGAVDYYIALTQFSRNKFIEGGFSPDKIMVKPNFVDFNPEKRDIIGKYVLYVGRLSEEKGISLLVKSWKHTNDLQLKVVGDGDMFDGLVKYAEVNNLNIDFLGQKSHSEVIGYIKNSLFVILPSLCYETFGRSIIEAFACGVPVIASRLGAMQELVEDGKTGLLFKAGDGEDMIKKINLLSSDTRLIAEMGNNARIAYEDKYTAEKNYEILMDIYKKAIESKPSFRAGQFEKIAL